MRMHKLTSVVGAIIIAAITAVSIGCNKKEEAPKPVTKDFTPEEFKTIKEGMGEAEVKEVLGEPKEAMQAMGITRKFWQVGDKYYSISFREGKVSKPFGPCTEEENDNLLGLMDAAQQWEQKKKNAK
jgi:hypothetical protein